MSASSVVCVSTVGWRTKEPSFSTAKVRQYAVYIASFRESHLDIDLLLVPAVLVNVHLLLFFLLLNTTLGNR